MSGFDKFMDDIVKREEVAKKRAKILSERENDEVHPQRQKQRLYQEKPQNSIRWRRK